MRKILVFENDKPLENLYGEEHFIKRSTKYLKTILLQTKVSLRVRLTFVYWGN